MNNFIRGLWNQHPIFRQLLGMCPTLAVTTTAVNGLAMGGAVIFVLFFSTCVVSIIKSLIPAQVRIAVYTVIIATFVTIVDYFFKAYHPDISAALGPYLPLIIVNCIILGRCEAFASKNTVRASVTDALGMGVGFTWGLFVLSGIREFLGQGTLLNRQVLPAGFPVLGVMVSAAGAFLALGFLVALMNRIEQWKT
ncbi:MAG: RnfABCDGE type electron transport complex subunit E [Candidatus Omnitrophica bacterium]|nr:RnfABCDGE type electron transport complex subunit E [Candidatus Omnitrophota bacterium]